MIAFNYILAQYTPFYFIRTSKFSAEAELFLTFWQFQPQIVFKLSLFSDLTFPNSTKLPYWSSFTIILLQSWTDSKKKPLYRACMQRVGAFKFLLPFSAAFKKWKKWLEMLLWTYMYISICVQEWKEILTVVWSNFRLVIVISLFLISGQISNWVLL